MPTTPLATPPVRILVVDDEPDTLESMAMYLRQRLDGVDVAEAASGHDALDMATDGVDILLTDFRMPGMDGIALIEAVHARWPHAAAMLMTAYPDVDVAIQAIQRGHVVHFFTKPPDPKEISLTMRHLLRGLRRDEALARFMARTS